MNKKVALVGSGLIGRGWMMLFANAGYEVRVYDADPSAADRALPAVADNLGALEEEGMIESATDLLQRIRFSDGLAEAVNGVDYIQESVWEDCALKKRVLEELGNAAAPDAILASSCSSIPPEDFMSGVRNRERCIIAHPFSPPHLIPLVEIVVTRWTSPEVADQTRALMTELGQRPVTVHKPVVGFVVNRLQAVVIDEAMALVKAGVISPEDLDACMSQGLGLRWAFIGPFETMDLNADRGIADYVRKYEEVYQGMLKDVRPRREWDAVAEVDTWLRSRQPGEAEISGRRLWRDRNLMKLAKLFRGPKLGGRK